MDPLSIVAASFSIAGAIAKASVAIFEFSREAKDAADDLSRVNGELQALSAILDPLTRHLSASSNVSAAFTRQLHGSLEGCSLVVVQVVDLVEKYRREGAWTKTKWVLVGRGEMAKLRESLEAYKMALSLGLDVISIAIQENIKRDTGALRNNNRLLQRDIIAIKVNTDEILDRVNSIRYTHGTRSAARVEEWVEEIEVLTSYAETAYQGTVSLGAVIDPSEWAPTDPHPNKGVCVSPTQEGSKECSGKEDDYCTLASVDSRGTVFLGAVIDPSEWAPTDPRPKKGVLPTHEGSKESSGNGDDYDTLAGLDSSAGPPKGRGVSPPQREPERSSSNTDGSDDTADDGPLVGTHKSRGVSPTQKGSEMSSVNSDNSDTVAPVEVPISTSTLFGRLGEYKEYVAFPGPGSPNITSQHLSTQEENHPVIAPAGNGYLDLVVGIDIGEASTAVAWMARETSVRHIRDWPGITGAKVPTLVSFNELENPMEWGKRHVKHLSLVKLLELDGSRCTSARMDLWVYFLRELYDNVRESISKELRIDRQTWAALTVEFHFTLPDVIREVPLPSAARAQAKLKGVLREAGIGTEARHYAILSLTEAEAVAATVFGEGGGDDFSTLVVKVGEGNMAIVEPREKARSRSDRRAFQAAVTLSRAAPAPEAFARQILNLLSQYPTVAVVASGPVAQSSAGVILDVLKREQPSVLRVPHTSPRGDPYLAAAKGLLEHRRPWHLSERPPLPAFAEVNTSTIFASLSAPTIFSRLAETFEDSHTSPRRRVMTNTPACFEIEIEHGKPPDFTPVYFDIISIFDGPGDAGRRTDDDKYPGGLKKVCTIQSSVHKSSFRAVEVKDKWYSSRRTSYVASIFLRPFAMEPSKAGPQFHVFIKEGVSQEEILCETDVTCYAEPPHMAWSLNKVVGQKAYHRTSELDADTRQMFIPVRSPREALHRAAQKRTRVKRNRLGLEQQRMYPARADEDWDER